MIMITIKRLGTGRRMDTFMSYEKEDNNNDVNKRLGTGHVLNSSEGKNAS